MSDAWYQSTKTKIKEHRWNELSLYDDADESKSHALHGNNRWLLRYLVGQEPFTQEMYEAVQTLFGPRTYQNWNMLFIDNGATFPIIERFLDNGEIDPTCSPSIMRYVLNHGMHDVEEKIQLLEKLIAHGGDINQKADRWGCSLLQSYMSLFYDRAEDEDLDFDEEEERRLISFLLQKGANPLSTCNRGRTAVDIVRRYGDIRTRIPRAFTRWILEEFQKYT